MCEKCRRILKQKEKRDEKGGKSKKRGKREEREGAEPESMTAEDFHKEEELILNYKRFMLLQSTFSFMEPKTLTKLFYTYRSWR